LAIKKKWYISVAKAKNIIALALTYEYVPKILTVVRISTWRFQHELI
jgi:hypothetical protein